MARGRSFLIGSYVADGRQLSLEWYTSTPTVFWYQCIQCWYFTPYCTLECPHCNCALRQLVNEKPTISPNSHHICIKVKHKVEEKFTRCVNMFQPGVFFGISTTF